MRPIGLTRSALATGPVRRAWALTWAWLLSLGTDLGMDLDLDIDLAWTWELSDGLGPGRMPRGRARGMRWFIGYPKCNQAEVIIEKRSEISESIMAETAVGLLVDRLIPLLAEEANLLRGIHREVDEITSELRSIQAFLKDADKTAQDKGDNRSHGVKLWVDELSEAAFQIEDVIDEYTYDMAERRKQHQDQRTLRRRFVCFFRKVSCFVAKLKPRHVIASKIQELKQKVEKINKRSSAYGFNSSTQKGSSSTSEAPDRSWSDPRDGSIFLKETELVGIRSDKEELVAKFEDKKEHVVIALVGMGGIGKTTLANQVFEEAKGKFDCHAWVSVSQSYNKLELLRTLIKRFYESMESAPQGIDQEMDQLVLMKKMRDYLQGKSYLVMFDDVWDINFWEHFKNGLPKESGRRGRIVLTTRKVEVANFCRTSASVHIHPMKLLSFKSSLELFYSKAFHSEDEKACPIDFVDLSRKIVERCQGLPLAIVVLGGLVATKDKNIVEWRKLLTCLSSELESINKILSLSYNDLPYNLKSCFLYLCIFPEDYSIRSHRLVRQWIAEGFVKPPKGKTLEVVAEECLAELINRSMVQVLETDVKGGVKSCRIHDLVREFILTNMEDLNICKVLSKCDSYDFKSITARRVSFFPGSHGASKSGDIPKTSRIRSVFSFDEYENLNPLVCTIVSNLKLVKVLDFEDCQGLDLLPDEIGNLFHLRYLSVRGTRVKILPKSIGKLENLETLDLKKSLVYELPVEMNKLCKLRHLLAYQENDPTHCCFNSRRGIKIQKGYGNLKALQKLQMVEANVEGVNVVEELSKLTKLKKLAINTLRSEDGTMLCECIQELKSLESLEVSAVSEDEVIDCNTISSPPQLLGHLYLHGRLRKFPEWIAKLHNLVRIVVRWSKLEEDPLKSLRHLPNLLEIRMSRDAYYGEKLEFEKRAFPKLKKLYIGYLSRLSSLVIEEGALPNLETLIIKSCPQLKEVPYGLHHLSNLKLLEFWEVPPQFLLFQNFQSLLFVPQVRFLFTLNGNYRLWNLKQVFEIQQYVKEHGEVEWNSMTSYAEISKVVWSDEHPRV